MWEKLHNRFVQERELIPKFNRRDEAKRISRSGSSKALWRTLSLLVFSADGAQTKAKGKVDPMDVPCRALLSA